MMKLLDATGLSISIGHYLRLLMAKACRLQLSKNIGRNIGEHWNKLENIGKNWKVLKSIWISTVPPQCACELEKEIHSFMGF